MPVVSNVDSDRPIVGGISVGDDIEIILTSEELEELLRDLPRMRPDLLEQLAKG